MIKKFFVVICIVMLLSALSLCAFSAEAKGAFSLALQYKQGEECFEGVEVFAFRIADSFEDGTYELCEPFSGYPVSIHGITSQTEWKRVANTLSSYAAADEIEAHLSAVTDGEGKVSFEKIEKGMYLVLSVTCESERGRAVFESFVCIVDGDETAFPKCESFTPAEAEVEYKVVKQWKDSAKDSRPEKIEIEILKNGERFETVFLTPEGDWCYKWTAKESDRFSVVERNVPEGFSVSIFEKEDTFVVTNTGEDSPDAPQTGESLILELWLLVACICGAGLLVTALWLRRTER